MPRFYTESFQLMPNGEGGYYILNSLFRRIEGLLFEKINEKRKIAGLPEMNKPKGF